MQRMQEMAMALGRSLTGFFISSIMKLRQFQPVKAKSPEYNESARVAGSVCVSSHVKF